MAWILPKQLVRALATASACLAAAPVAQSEPAPSTLSAYVQLFGAYMYGYHRANDGFNEAREQIPGVGGSGHAAWQATSNVSVQLDLWADRWSGRVFDYCDGEPCGERSWGTWRAGGAAHLTYHLPGGLQVGGVASMGYRKGFDGWANLGVEVAYNSDRLRLNAQAGYTPPLVEWARDGDVRGYYGHAGVTFYARPTLAVSANAGMDIYRDCCGFTERTVTFGARVEVQPVGTPMALFAAYQGRFWKNTDTGVGDLNQHHFFGVGLSLLVGQDTIQNRDRAVGFSDYNGIYSPILR